MRQNNYNGVVNITVTGSNNCATASNTKGIYVGLPTQPNLTILGVSPYGAVDVQASTIAYAISYDWYRDGSFLKTTNSFLTTLNGGSCGQNHYMQVSITNECGTSPLSESDYSTSYSYFCSYYRVYPNPTKDYITIEFDQVDKAESLPDEIDLVSEKSAKPIQVVNVQDEYKNNKLVNGKDVVLNVKDLARGTYYLHIKNSKNRDNPVDKIRILLE